VRGCHIFYLRTCTEGSWEPVAIISKGWDYVSEMHLPTSVLFIPLVIYEHGEPWWNDIDGFTSHPKEGVLRILIALKNPSPRPGLNTRTLGPMASTLTITPPRRLWEPTFDSSGSQSRNIFLRRYTHAQWMWPTTFLAKNWPCVYVPYLYSVKGRKGKGVAH
jgi:hypothetical protein